MKTKINYVTKRGDNRYGKRGKTLHERPYPTRSVVIRPVMQAKRGKTKKAVTARNLSLLFKIG
jgi:hypothetical protein